MTVARILKRSLAPVSAVFISILSAIFAWQQVDVSRVHNRKSVMPILQVTPYMEGKERRNGIYLSNDGLGPAIVKGFSVSSGNVVASGFGSDRWSEVLSATTLNSSCFATGWPKGETAIRAGSDMPLLSITNADGYDMCMVELVKLIGGKPIEINIEYESIYGDVMHLSATSKISSQTLDSLHKKLVASGLSHH
ncbi:hypothetical protein VX159_07440 [Dechloromonas sp. ZY10]|uniref:hypothetical protein n=1 Tax=Dechloromonas aquae TaxID=2664436 RepID=UPI003526F9E4